MFSKTDRSVKATERTVSVRRDILEALNDAESEAQRVLETMREAGVELD